MFELLKLNRAIKNNSTKVVLSYNKYIIELLNVLWDSKYILGYEKNKKLVTVFLKYNRWGVSTIKSIKPISKPSKSYFINNLNRNKVLFAKQTIFISCNSNLGYILGTCNDVTGKILFKLEL